MPPLAVFLPRFAAVLRDDASLKEVGLYEFLGNLLRSATPAAIEDIRKEDRGAEELLRACLQSMRGNYNPNLVEGMVVLASHLGQDPRWREETIAALRALGKKGNYHFDKALRRLELSAHGIPEDSEWDKLPADFVPSKWAEANLQGRAELLKLADHQLVYAFSKPPDPGILRFFLKVAMSPGDVAQRLQAMDRYDDRSRLGDAIFHPSSLQELFGPAPEQAMRIAEVLRVPELCVNRDVVNFVGRWLERLDAAAIEEHAEAAPVLLPGLEALLLRPDAASMADQSLVRAGLAFLERLGLRPRRRDEVRRVVTAALASTRMNLKMLLERLLPKLAPPPPEPEPEPEPEPVEAGHQPIECHHRPDPEALHRPPPPPPPEENPYVAKQRIAEKMGKELQTAIFRVMASAMSVEEKVQESTRLSEEFQARIKELYGA
jgi:hypothetical protein